MKIRPEILISDLVASWKNGNKKYVLDTLEHDHPGLTSVFLIQSAQDRTLSLSDCNEIANLLLDRRVALVREDEEPGYVAVDTDEMTILFKGCKGECQCYAYEKNSKVLSNGGEACYHVLSEKQANIDGYTER